MKSAVQLIVLLACIFHCMSGNPITRCRCINTTPTVRRPLIAYVEVFEPSPFCNKQEVIAVMNDKNERCLDLESNFTKRLLQDRAKRRTASTETLSRKTTTTTAATTKTTTSPSVTRQ